MINLKSSFTLFILLICVKAYAQDLVKISPQKPQAGEVINISFDPKGSKIPDSLERLFINFTSSNFYEMPSRLPMKKDAGVWKVSFKLPIYSRYTSFTVSDLSKAFVHQPTDTSHYEFFVYKKDKLVEGNYLAKGHSLSVQNRKSSTLQQQQQAFYKKELSVYPDNYEAQLYILNYHIKTEAGKAKWQARRNALAVIEKKFRSNPTFAGNINKTTMGYLIIGEPQKVDSIRQVIVKEFPNAIVSIENKLSRLIKNKNADLVADSLQLLLSKASKENLEAYTSAYDYLLKYYVKKKDEVNALRYYSLALHGDTTPYQWKNYSNYAKFFEENNMLLDSAKKLNTHVLSNLEKYPTSVIRYFPETGYLIGFDEKRAQNLKQIEVELKAMQGILSYKLGDKNEAIKWLTEVKSNLNNLKSKELLVKIAETYKAMKDESTAQQFLGMAYKVAPFDAHLTDLLKKSVNDAGGKDADFKRKIAELDKEWKETHFDDLKKIVLDLPFPDFQIVDMNKKPLTAADLKGKIVVMDLWATWCKPCLAFFPYLQVIYDKYKDDKDVVFVILNSASGNTFEDAFNWVDKNKDYSFPFYYNQDKKMGAKLDVTTIPTTFILDKNSKIRFKKVGNEGEKAMPQLDAMIEFIKQQN